MKLKICALAVLAAAGAARAGGEFEVKRDIPYYPDGVYTNDHIKTFCKLDLRVPKGRTKFATVVWFHGGGLKTMHSQAAPP